MLPHKEFKLITLLQGNNIVFLYFLLYSLFFFDIKVLQKINESFSKNYFLENYYIFLCLVANLKISQKTFPGVWYAQKIINIFCIIQNKNPWFTFQG